MAPIFADAINFPLVLGCGVVILVPLLAFEIAAEAWILRTLWHQKFLDLCRFTLLANIWSLAAGIPAKILNGWLYSLFLPGDLPGFFSRYPVAVWTGTFIYFLITIVVEVICAIRWLKKSPHSVTKNALWWGILLANLATYTVVAPLHYFSTRPTCKVKEFLPNTTWALETNTTVLFVNKDSQLHSIQLDGSRLTRIVPGAVRDFLVSANLNLCLFRGGDGNLYFYDRDTGQSNLVWQTTERFLMNQVAFSPSGKRIAVAQREGNYVEVIEIGTGKRIRQELLPIFNFRGPTLAWSNEELRFYLRGFESNERVEVLIQPDLSLRIQALEHTNNLSLLTCFGRVGEGGWYGGDDWGNIFNSDTCGDLKVWTEPGLGSGLRIFREGAEQNSIVHLYVNPGLLHLARFYFADAAFLGNCQECLFEANGYIYLLDIPNKRVGTLARGNRFILFTDRYRKKF